MKFGKGSLNMFQRPKNDLRSVTFVGLCSPCIEMVAFVDMSSQPGWITHLK